jgi:hypothetical protein
VALAAIDNAGLTPENWAYQVTLIAGDQAPQAFTCLLPSSPSTTDFCELVPAALGDALSACLPTTGGTLSGKLTLGGTPPLKLPSGTSGDVLTSDGSGNITWRRRPGA